MNRTRVAVASTLVVCAELKPAPAAGPAVASAYKLCSLIESHRSVTGAQCRVLKWDGSVDLTVDKAPPHPKTVCAAVVAFASQHGISFAPGWKLNIYSAR